MAKRTEQNKDIKGKTEEQLRALVADSKEILRAERFKDKFTRKAGLIRNTKKQVARALTELRTRAMSVKQTDSTTK